MNVLQSKGSGRSGTLKHRLVCYVKNYSKEMFYQYTLKVTEEMQKRKIRYQEKYLKEIQEFCKKTEGAKEKTYPEHNERYKRQCYFNLEEKFDRGIISKEEFKKIQEKIM